MFLEESNKFASIWVYKRTNERRYKRPRWYTWKKPNRMGYIIYLV